MGITQCKLDGKPFVEEDKTPNQLNAILADVILARSDEINERVEYNDDGVWLP